ncbi:MAG: helix-hairpin-helix domain-containing protein [Pirellulaceae bacterium]|jgi:putative hydrolase|nr:helix-hairpin-helix domain-containing protein [Pirellulaceae bacterium]MDP6556841.1 helix-hairpin-helix domain-containing protein [Pirellulaceae bacterium]MDP6722540.1 helix-hairpin-helix domain-containing protein [Pirellulaceae bacterium]
MAVTNTKQSPPKTCPTNLELATALRETADLLETQGANQFRVRAYRNAAETVERLEAPLWHTVEAEGATGLVRFPAIGRSIAGALAHMIRTGKFPLLERLRGDDAPQRLFATVADIGPKLAQRIHEHLGIETLWELETAAQDGRLAQVPGLGPKRLRAVRESLAGRFRRPMPKNSPATAEMELEAPIKELLDVDRQYRELAKKQQLPRIAPRRFNPTHEAWLPVLHTERESRHYTALFSNSVRAHELGTTHDWVVIYRDDNDNHGQWTVITSNFGKLRGKRIVRGREAECASYYTRQAALATARQSHGGSQRTLLSSGVN